MTNRPKSPTEQAGEVHSPLNALTPMQYAERALEACPECDGDGEIETHPPGAFGPDGEVKYPIQLCWVCDALKLSVAQVIDQAIKEARKDERKACAEIAESMRPSGGRQWSTEQAACFAALTDCAANIRRRSEQPEG